MPICYHTYPPLCLSAIWSVFTTFKPFGLFSHNWWFRSKMDMQRTLLSRKRNSTTSNVCPSHTSFFCQSPFHPSFCDFEAFQLVSWTCDTFWSNTYKNMLISKSFVTGLLLNSLNSATNWENSNSSSSFWSPSSDDDAFNKTKNMYLCGCVLFTYLDRIGYSSEL